MMAGDADNNPLRRADPSKEEDILAEARRARWVTRRDFLVQSGLMVSAAALAQISGVLRDRGWLAEAQAAEPDLIRETFSGLVAFVVPGPDAYSLAQGMSTVEPGGVDAGVVDVLIATLDESTPFVPSFSATVAAVLNGLAQTVNPSAGGTFVSPFARLSFAEKAAVFQIVDATDSLKLLGGLLPLFVAFFCYSEAGVLNRATRSLTGTPVGWELSHYQGASDGRDEFVGYFEHRRKG